MQEDIKFQHLLLKVSGLFYKYGLRSISMDDIARELGISKKTLYVYVSNKAELIEAVMKVNRDIICDRMAQVIKVENNAIDELLEISRIVNTHHESFNSIMIFDLEKFYPELYVKFKEEKVKEVHRFISDNLHKGISEGFYRSDIDINLVASLYIKKMEDVHDGDFFKGLNLSLEQIFAVMFENHIRGISNEKGISYFEKIKDEYKNQHTS